MSEEPERKRSSRRRIKARLLMGRNVPLQEAYDRNLLGWMHRLRGELFERDLNRELVRYLAD